MDIGALAKTVSSVEGIDFELKTKKMSAAHIELFEFRLGTKSLYHVHAVKVTPFKYENQTAT